MSGEGECGEGEVRVVRFHSLTYFLSYLRPAHEVGEVDPNPNPNPNPNSYLRPAHEVGEVNCVEGRGVGRPEGRLGSGSGVGLGVRLGYG